MSSMRVTARNTSPDSKNPIHTDAALRHGFSGAIVPGLTLFAYAFAEPHARWGNDWLGRGEASMRFKRPVYDGDSLLITCTEHPNTEQVESAVPGAASGGGDVLDVEVHVEGRGLCADGSFRRRTDTARPLAVSFPAGPTPAEPPPVDEHRLRNAGPLPVLPIDTSPAYVASWLDAHEVADPTYRTLLHPAMLSRVSAHVLPLRFRFDEPRVHRGLRASFFATRPIGAPLSARGRVMRVWDHRGHGYVSSEFVVVDDHTDEVVVHLESESIFRLRS